MSRAINLLKQGQTEEAITILRAEVKRDEDNVHAWHHLGFAFEKKGDADEARKAHKKAAELGDALLNSGIDGTRLGSFSDMLIPIGRELKEAGESARRYIDLDRKLSRSKRSEWSNRAEALLGFAELAIGDRSNATIFKIQEVDVRPRILSKPEPSYTEAARKNQTTGTVILLVILAADGRILGIHPVKELEDGLTRQAVRAAAAIRFVPAMKDGKPVSVLVQVEYNFNLY